MRQVARRGFQEDVEGETVALAGLEQAILPIRQHLEHFLVVAADGDDDIPADHDPERNGRIRDVAIQLAVGNADQDEGEIFIPFHARHFIKVE